MCPSRKKPKKIALLAGSTGAVGQELMKLLLTSDRYSQVHHLGRKPLDLEHPKLVQHVHSFEKLPQVELNTQLDEVFCALGSTIKKAGTFARFQQIDRDYVVELGKLAQRHGANTFSVISSIGADPNSRNDYLRTKGEMEKGLSALHLSALHIFRPSLLWGKRAEFRLGEFLALPVLKVLSPLLMGKIRKYRPVEFSQLAEKMLVAARMPNPGVAVFENFG